ncbi:MAG: hypothetical protein K9N21_18355 [Deltaproteobacteria bacterium]|nr:hypothetical protein [Deltaproteobacteria bacterium]
MSVLLFSSGMRKEEHQVRQILRKLDQDVEVYRSVHRLSRRFEQPRGNICLMIFVVGSQDILNHLLLMRGEIYNLPVALILPDAGRETMLKGHKFYPRFITFTGGDYSDLSLALQNMLRRERINLNQGTGEVVKMDVV